MKVFLLEDDETLGFGIGRYLARYGYEVVQARSIREARELFDYGFDLVILDVNLPDGTGFDFLKLYSLGETPLIFLTVRDAEEDIVRGLNLADGYITKPFKLAILRAKIESIMRRVDSRDQKLNYRGLVLDGENYSCYLEGEALDLTAKEYELLSLLLINRGRTLTRQRILERIWDLEGSFVEDNTLSATVKRLRKKLGDYSYVIETVRGVGYRFVRD